MLKVMKKAKGFHRRRGYGGQGRRFTFTIYDLGGQIVCLFAAVKSAFICVYLRFIAISKV
jgi:hypothetical protein